MLRREFVVLTAGALASWPLAVCAQPADRPRRIGVLLPAATGDAAYEGWLTVFLQELARLGWTVDGKISLDVRWAVSAADIRRHAAELAKLSPDLIFAHGSATVGRLLEETSTIPIVFPIVSDPVAAGYVASLARPGGNATGFLMFEYSLGGKWLELLKQIAPNVNRVAVLRDPGLGSGTSQFAAIQAVAPSLRVEVLPINLRDPAETERAVTAFAHGSDGGLILTSGPSSIRHRDLITSLAARHKLPAIYYERVYVAAGGLISYGTDYPEQYRQAAGYVDRILKGEKPSDLPVQAPVRYELVVNLKAAKALGLDIPTTLLARADAVIE